MQTRLFFLPLMFSFKYKNYNTIRVHFYEENQTLNLKQLHKLKELNHSITALKLPNTFNYLDFYLESIFVLRKLDRR